MPLCPCTSLQHREHGAVPQWIICNPLKLVAAGLHQIQPSLSKIIFRDNINDSAVVAAAAHVGSNLIRNVPGKV